MTMPISPDGTTAGLAESDAPIARGFRYLYRMPLLIWHLSINLPLAFLLITPLTAQLRVNDHERLDHRVIRAWSAGLMRIFGFRLQRIGNRKIGATLFVANHVSWVDIVVLHSQRMMGFVAKREISRWPVIGWMATRAETIYHRRGNQESLGGVLQEMLTRLRSGRSVGVFPEGKTRDGRELGPFHARIFLAAVEAGAPVQPVALRYGVAASAQTRVAFQSGESFVANFFRLLGDPSRQVDIVFLQPIEPGDAEGRRRIAEIARDRIAASLRSP